MMRKGSLFTYMMLLSTQGDMPIEQEDLRRNRRQVPGNVLFPFANSLAFKGCYARSENVFGSKNIGACDRTIRDHVVVDTPEKIACGRVTNHFL